MVSGAAVRRTPRLRQVETTELIAEGSMGEQLSSTPPAETGERQRAG